MFHKERKKITGLKDKTEHPHPGFGDIIRVNVRKIFKIFGVDHAGLLVCLHSSVVVCKWLTFMTYGY